MRENESQPYLKKRIEERIPDCRIFKNDPLERQGFPDLSIHRKGRVAYLEVKRSSKARKQPNQEYYIDTLSAEGAFAKFIFPENEEEILDELERALGVRE